MRGGVHVAVAAYISALLYIPSAVLPGLTRTMPYSHSLALRLRLKGSQFRVANKVC